MKLETVLHQVLGVAGPWQVTKVRDDLGRNQIDVWLGKGGGLGGWFFGGRSSQSEGPEQVWRHVNIGDCRCMIHAPVPDDASLDWAGEPGLPFTHAMSRMIATMMRDGIRLQTICDLLDVAVADLWKFKHTLDSGKAGLSGVVQPQGTMTVDSRVPEPEHPVWVALLDGSAQLDIKLLSLKLFLSKLREQMRVITDPEVRVLKTYELQRYFLRYETALSHELDQLDRMR